MGIKRFVADKDTTITNAYKQNMSSVATASNMGAADVLEAFSIYAQASTSSKEESRILVNFPISDIQVSRSAGDIPASGSVNFYLKLFNAEHGSTLPVDYTMQISAITKSWDEGYGLDMDEYTDPGYASGIGATWDYAASGSTWSTDGADFYTGASNQYDYTASFGENGTENIDVDVTNLVEDWLKSTATLSGSNGFGIRLSPATASLNKSYYTKKFHARDSEFFFKRPVLEARWNGALKDNAGNFYASSSLVADNSNKLYFYNLYKGQKQNVPGIGTGNVTLDLYATLGGSSLAGATGSWVSTGIYSASITLDNTASSVYPVWSKPGSADGGTAATTTLTVLMDNSGGDLLWNDTHFTLIPWDGPPITFDFIYNSANNPALGNTQIGIDGTSTKNEIADAIATSVGAYGNLIFAEVGGPGGEDVIFTQGTTGEVGNTGPGTNADAPHGHISDPMSEFLGGTDGTPTAATDILTCSAVTVNSHAASCYNPNPTYVSNITNLKSIYSTDETAKFRVYTRQKDWCPTIYTVASKAIAVSIVEEAHFRVIRLIDNHEVIQYDTGSNSTLMSYDSAGSYFELDMAMFEKDYAYGITFLYKVNDKYVEQSEMFKFRVE